MLPQLHCIAMAASGITHLGRFTIRNRNFNHTRTPTRAPPFPLLHRARPTCSCCCPWHHNTSAPRSPMTGPSRKPQPATPQNTPPAPCFPQSAKVQAVHSPLSHIALVFSGIVFSPYGLGSRHACTVRPVSGDTRGSLSRALRSTRMYTSLVVIQNERQSPIPKHHKDKDG